jgi:WD40 repeat protein
MGCSDGRVRIWDVASGKRLTTIETGETTWIVAWHPDGALIATGDREGKIRIWTDTGDELAQRQAPAEVVSVRFSPDGDSIAAASMDQGVMWRIPSWRGATAELERLAQCASGWEIHGDRVVWVDRTMRTCGTR